MHRHLQSINIFRQIGSMQILPRHLLFKTYYMIIMLKFMEPEAKVKLVQSFLFKIYLVCI